MATITDSKRRFSPRIQAPPEWGIEPVPPTQRILGALDYAVLWGDLGIGLLVMLAGTLLVPGLSLRDAIAAIAIGSVLGCLLLALIGAMGSDTAVPTMVLLRPALGIRGSYLPSALNVLQLIGWTIFEFIIMGVAADAIGRALFGVSNFALWTAIFAAIVILMGIGGPIGVVRQWLEKFAVWIALATGLWLTYYYLATYGLNTLWSIPADRSNPLPFWVGVDIAIALPISWLPLVADYNRFAKQTPRAFWGTFIGFAITNFWFLSLGALALIGAKISTAPKEFSEAIALTAGWIALLILLADETHNAWADLYSSAVSLQNVFPKIRQRWLIIGLGATCFIVAILLDITQYQNFLFLIGSFFIPAFGVAAGDYFLLRQRKYDTSQLYQTNGTYWYASGFNVLGLSAWGVGIVVYHLTNPLTLGAFFADWQRIVPDYLTAYGGSIPSFAIAFFTYLLLAFAFMRRTK